MLLAIPHLFSPQFCNVHVIDSTLVAILAHIVMLRTEDILIWWDTKIKGCLITANPALDSPLLGIIYVRKYCFVCLSHWSKAFVTKHNLSAKKFLHDMVPIAGRGVWGRDWQKNSKWEARKNFSDALTFDLILKRWVHAGHQYVLIKY